MRLTAAEEGLLGVLPSPSGTPYCELPGDQSVGGYPNTLQIAELGVDPAALDALAPGLREELIAVLRAQVEWLEGEFTWSGMPEDKPIVKLLTRADTLIDELEGKRAASTE